MSLLLFVLLNLLQLDSCKLLAKPTTYESIIHDMLSLDSPQKIRVYLKDFKYERDRGIDIEPMVKDPFLFIKDHKGDCKDFANFGYRCGILNNKDVNYLAVYPKDSTKLGHAFCIWKVNKKYYPICNYTCMYPYVKFEFDNISDIIDQYKKAFDWKSTYPPKEAFPLPYGLFYYPRLFLSKEL